MRILIFFLTFLFSLNIYSQTEYPRIEKDINNKKVVIFTIEQAHKINNKLELLNAYKYHHLVINEYDSINTKLINDKKEIILMKEAKISQLNLLINNKDKQINNLNSQLSNYSYKVENYNSELENKDKEIKLHIDKIDEQRLKIITGTITSGVIITGLIYLLIR